MAITTTNSDRRRQLCTEQLAEYEILLWALQQSWEIVCYYFFFTAEETEIQKFKNSLGHMVVRGGAQLKAIFVRPSPPNHHAQFLYPSSSTWRHFLLEALFPPKDISPFMEVLWSFSWLQTIPLSTIRVLSPLRSTNFFCKRQDGTHFRFCGPYGLCHYCSTLLPTIAQKQPQTRRTWVSVAVSQENLTDGHWNLSFI